MGDRDGGGGAAESYARKRQYDYTAVRFRLCVVSWIWRAEASVQQQGASESEKTRFDVDVYASCRPMQMFFRRPYSPSPSPRYSLSLLTRGTCRLFSISRSQRECTQKRVCRWNTAKPDGLFGAVVAVEIDLPLLLTSLLTSLPSSTPTNPNHTN